MSRTNTRTLLALALVLAIACTGVGCANNPQVAETEPSQQEQASKAKKTEGVVDERPVEKTPEAEAEKSDNTSGGTEKATKHGLSEDCVLVYFEDERLDKLVADMEAGRIPTECNLLYDQMGSLPDVTVTDEKTIAQVFDMLCGMRVIGPSDWSITDCYHHVYFTLRDGTKAGFSFEGEGNIVRKDGNWLVEGDGPLWQLVRQIQSEHA